MKSKILSTFILLTSTVCCYAQQWVIDDIADERKNSEPITLFDIIALCILGVTIWGGYKLYKFLKSLDYTKYIKIRNVVIVVCLVITAAIPITILTYFDLKRDRLQEEAIKSLNNIVNNAGSYIQPSEEYITFREIEPYDNMTPRNSINYNFAYKTLLENGVRTPYKGVYRCFDIDCLGSQVLFAKFAKEKGFSSEEEPALYHGFIKPYRIRYYNPDNVNPERDLRSVYRDFLQNFIWEHQSQLRSDITNEFFHRSLNEYYNISHLSHKDGAALWRDNKLYYEHEVVQECSFEYKTINYGNFDITYCISRPCVIGVQEKHIPGKIFGKEIWDEAHIIKRNQCLAKYCTTCGVLLLGICSIFYFGRPKRKKNYNKFFTF